MPVLNLGFKKSVCFHMLSGTSVIAWPPTDLGWPDGPSREMRDTWSRVTSSQVQPGPTDPQSTYRLRETINGGCIGLSCYAQYLTDTVSASKCSVCNKIRGTVRLTNNTK